MNREQFRTITRKRLTEAYGYEPDPDMLTEIVRDAGEYSAHLIEAFAHPRIPRYDADIPVAIRIERDVIANHLRGLIEDAPKDQRSGKQYVSAERIEALMRKMVGCRQ